MPEDAATGVPAIPTLEVGTSCWHLSLRTLANRSARSSYSATLSPICD
jgi:hypothetical protein